MRNVIGIVNTNARAFFLLKQSWIHKPKKKSKIILMIIRIFSTSFFNNSSASPLVMFLLYHLLEDEFIIISKSIILSIKIQKEVHRRRNSDSLKSLKVGAKFFSHICAGDIAYFPNKWPREKKKVTLVILLSVATDSVMSKM